MKPGDIVQTPNGPGYLLHPAARTKGAEWIVMIGTKGHIVSVDEMASTCPKPRKKWTSPEDMFTAIDTTGDGDMTAMDPGLAWALVISIAGIAFVIVGAWATADVVSRAAYWVRRIQATMLVIAAAALFAWAVWSLIVGGVQ
jgi:hypothetical protein